MDDDVRWLSREEALERLEVIDYDPGDGLGPCVHTLRDAGFALVGAHWYLSDVEALMEQNGVSEAGPNAEALNHALVTEDENGFLYLGTKVRR